MMLKKTILGSAVAAVVMMSGCASLVSPVPYPENEVKTNYPVLAGMPVSANHTPYSPSLVCLGEEGARGMSYMGYALEAITIGEIKDLTGRFDYESGGYKITQGAQHMMQTGLMKTGVFRVVDRSDVTITDYERTLAANSLVSDFDMNDSQYVRKVTAGEVIGSQFKVVGAITELNYNIDSGGYEGSVVGIGSKARRFVSNVAIDLFLVDTRSTQIIKAVSVQKQLVGYETRHGVFRFFGEELFDVAVGDKRQEPLQLAVRSAVEHGVFEFAKAVYGPAPSTCQELKDMADGLSGPVTIQPVFEEPMVPVEEPMIETYGESG